MPLGVWSVFKIFQGQLRYYAYHRKAYPEEQDKWGWMDRSGHLFFEDIKNVMKNTNDGPEELVKIKKSLKKWIKIYFLTVLVTMVGFAIEFGLMAIFFEVN